MIDMLYNSQCPTPPTAHVHSSLTHVNTLPHVSSSDFGSYLLQLLYMHYSPPNVIPLHRLTILPHVTLSPCAIPKSTCAIPKSTCAISSSLDVCTSSCDFVSLNYDNPSSCDECNLIIKQIALPLQNSFRHLWCQFLLLHSPKFKIEILMPWLQDRSLVFLDFKITFVGAVSLTTEPRFVKEALLDSG